MSSLYLKEAELQYCHSHLSECEFTLESQSKELAMLRVEQENMRAELVEARAELEQLLERWLEEKREEAKRMNQHNDAQQRRWQSFTNRLARLQQCTPECCSLAKTDTPVSTCAGVDAPLGYTPSSHPGSTQGVGSSAEVVIVVLYAFESQTCEVLEHKVIILR
ncbi:hypothetical protein JZ751_024364, partial [Albula glossodonta]